MPQMPVAQSRSPQLVGSISGVVVDPSGAAIAGATARLVWEDPSRNQLVRTDSGGEFTFLGVGAGSFKLTVTAPGFAPATATGTISAGQVYTAPQITLEVATNDTEVQVEMTREEIAQEQLNVEEKQRLIGVFPNYYVSYAPNPMPLTAKQKFTLAGRLLIDPVSFGVTGVTAGIEQANNSYSGFGQGASGYAKRYAASTGTFLDGVLIGNAILPAVFKQDPRYFYKGTGSVKSRVLYAIAMSVMCKGDNGNWQVNYSGIGGGLAAGAISNFYYPAKDRDGLELTFANAAIGTAESAAGNIVQEFFFRKLTSHSSKAKADPSPAAPAQP